MFVMNERRDLFAEYPSIQIGDFVFLFGIEIVDKVTEELVDSIFVIDRNQNRNGHFLFG